jgi:hypothetical protein
LSILPLCADYSSGTPGRRGLLGGGAGCCGAPHCGAGVIRSNTMTVFLSCSKIECRAPALLAHLVQPPGQKPHVDRALVDLSVILRDIAKRLHRRGRWSWPWAIPMNRPVTHAGKALDARSIGWNRAGPRTPSSEPMRGKQQISPHGPLARPEDAQSWPDGAARYEQPYQASRPRE